MVELHAASRQPLPGSPHLEPITIPAALKLQGGALEIGPEAHVIALRYKTRCLLCLLAFWLLPQFVWSISVLRAVSGPCTSIVLTGVEPQPDQPKLGKYVRQLDRDTNGRPAYYSARHDAWLYWFPAYMEWRLGPLLGEEQAWMFVASHANVYSPEYIAAGVWFAWDETEWAPLAVGVVCGGDGYSRPKPHGHVELGVCDSVLLKGSGLAAHGDKMGVYELQEAESHGRSTYYNEAAGAFLYFSEDDKEGNKHADWMIGPKLGGTQIWLYAPDAGAAETADRISAETGASWLVYAGARWVNASVRASCDGHAAPGDYWKESGKPLTKAKPGSSGAGGALATKKKRQLRRTGHCREGGQCASGECRGGRCCTALGLTEGCVECTGKTGKCFRCMAGFKLGKELGCLRDPALSLSDWPPDNAAPCATVVLSGTPAHRAHFNPQNDKLGAFVHQTEDTTNGKRAYFNAGTQAWLYYHERDEGRGGDWMVGPRLNDKSAWLFVPDDARYADRISAATGWQAWDGDKWATTTVRATCLSAPMGAGAASSCSEAVLTGAPSALGDKNGGFRRNGTLNGRPLYKSTWRGTRRGVSRETAYLYWYQNFSEWRLGPAPGGVEAWMFTQSTEHTADRIPGGWHTWNGSSWRDCRGCMFDCVAEERRRRDLDSCKVVALAGNPPVHAERLGTFVQQRGNITGGRPAFWNSKAGAWLFYLAEPDGWIVGPILGIDRAWTIVDDAALSPELISPTAQWSVFHGMKWVSSVHWGGDWQVRATCMERYGADEHERYLENHFEPPNAETWRARRRERQRVKKALHKARWKARAEKRRRSGGGEARAHAEERQGQRSGDGADGDDALDDEAEGGGEGRVRTADEDRAWGEYITKGGRAYYYNILTRVSSWSMPTAMRARQSLNMFTDEAAKVRQWQFDSVLHDARDAGDARDGKVVSAKQKHNPESGRSEWALTICWDGDASSQSVHWEREALDLFGGGMPMPMMMNALPHYDNGEVCRVTPEPLSTDNAGGVAAPRKGAQVDPLAFTDFVVGDAAAPSPSTQNPAPTPPAPKPPPTPARKHAPRRAPRPAARLAPKPAPIAQPRPAPRPMPMPAPKSLPAQLAGEGEGDDADEEDDDGDDDGARGRDDHRGAGKTIGGDGSEGHGGGSEAGDTDEDLAEELLDDLDEEEIVQQMFS
eukprot:g1898.t1